MKYMGHEVLQALKTRNAINRANPGRTLQFKLRNVSVNGQKRGCVGHVTDLDTGACVFIDTERSVMEPHEMLYRTAKDEQDFTGGTNNFAGTLEELVKGVSRLLDKQVKAEAKEERMAKFEKTTVWMQAKDGVEEIPGYKFKAELPSHPDVEDFHFGLVKKDGGWVVVDPYTGISTDGKHYATRDKAAKETLEVILPKYDAFFMSEMHEAKAHDFQLECIHAKGYETKGEQVKQPVKKQPKKEEPVKQEVEVAETVAVSKLHFLDGDKESAEKAMAALRKLTEGGNVVIRWKGKPMAPIRVEGDTKPYQEQLKGCGLRWARKGFWYLKPTMA